MHCVWFSVTPVLHFLGKAVVMFAVWSEVGGMAVADKEARGP